MHFAPTEVWAPPRSREQAQVLQRPARARHRCVRMVLVALALRLAVAPLLYQQQLDPQRDHWPFGYEAGRIARSIVQGRGFGSPLFAETGPTAWMPPHTRTSGQAFSRWRVVSMGFGAPRRVLVDGILEFECRVPES